MKAISNSVVLVRLAGMLVVCLAVPPLLWLCGGPALGALGAAGAAALWYSQYRIPAWKEKTGSPFWFVAGGYVFIGIILLVSLGRALG